MLTYNSGYHDELSTVFCHSLKCSGHRRVRAIADRRATLRPLRRRAVARNPPAAAALLRPRGPQSRRRFERLRTRLREYLSINAEPICSCSSTLLVDLVWLAPLLLGDKLGFIVGLVGRNVTSYRAFKAKYESEQNYRLTQVNFTCDRLV